MNNLDKTYTDLLKDILENGTQKGDRTGTGTISVFGRQIRHKMSEGFPLLTTKKMYFKGVVTELLWFLRGDTNIKYLVDNNCHIWDGDAYKNYLNNPDYKAENYSDLISSQAGQLVKCPTQEEFINKIKTNRMFAFEWGELGPIYGAQWRRWFPGGIDQIANLIHDLKTNPDSRRNKVSAWNVAEIDQMTLPPCHYGFQVYTRELSREERKEILYGRFRKGPIIINGESYVECAPTDINFEFFNTPTRAISLMWNQRSVDTFLGLPFNIASYGLLLEIIAKAVNMVPDELIGNLGDTHLYLNHVEQAKEQIGREFTFDERLNLLKKLDLVKEKRFIKAKNETIYNLANYYNIPTRTREPYPLPKLVFGKTYEFFKSLGEDLSLITHLDSSDFEIEGYQSHPVIKAPLSN